MHVICGLAAYLLIEMSSRESPEAPYSSHCAAPVLTLQQHPSIATELPGQQALNSCCSLRASNGTTQRKGTLLTYRTRKRYTMTFSTVLRLWKLFHSSSVSFLSERAQFSKNFTPLFSQWHQVTHHLRNCYQQRKLDTNY